MAFVQTTPARVPDAPIRKIARIALKTAEYPPLIVMAVAPEIHNFVGTISRIPVKIVTTGVSAVKTLP